MSEFKGTKGKWDIKHSESKDAWNIIGTVLGGKYKIARIPYYKDSRLSDSFNDFEKREANYDAKLISKSPEMLEMLKECLDELHDYSDASIGKVMIPKIEKLIKEATEL